MKGDPFYESQENHNLIGVANIFLEALFYDVKLDYHVPIISQQGEVRFQELCSYLSLFGTVYLLPSKPTVIVSLLLEDVCSFLKCHTNVSVQYAT